MQQAAKVGWIKGLHKGQRGAVVKAINAMPEDDPDPVLFCGWNAEAFNYKRDAAANNGGVTTPDQLAALIEAHGGTRIDGSDCTFAFPDMNSILQCKRQMLEAAPWVRHVDASWLSAAAVAALGALTRPICDDVVLILNVPASGSASAARFPEFFMG